MKVICKREGQHRDYILKEKKIRQIKPERKQITNKTYSPIQCRCVNSDTQERSPPGPVHQESAKQYESMRDTSPVWISSIKAGNH